MRRPFYPDGEVSGWAVRGGLVSVVSEVSDLPSASTSYA